MEEQKTNKKITIGIVAVLLIVLVTIGETYAYFSAQAETGTQTVTTGTLSMNFNKAGSAVTLSGIVTSINATHFLDNPITSMFIPETVNASNSSFSIGDLPLKTLIVPGGVTKSEDTFANTLTDLIIMDGITNIRKLGTTSITSIEIPVSVNIISRYAFDGNPNLTEIVVRGKTEVPDTFATDWNCTEWDSSTDSCAKYANVVYRP